MVKVLLSWSCDVATSAAAVQRPADSHSGVTIVLGPTLDPGPFPQNSTGGGWMDRIGYPNKDRIA